MLVEIRSTSNDLRLARGTATEDGCVEWSWFSNRAMEDILVNPVWERTPGNAGYLEAMRAYMARSTNMMLVELPDDEAAR